MAEFTRSSQTTDDGLCASKEVDSRTSGQINRMAREQKRRQQARQTGTLDGPIAKDVEGTPEWYVKRILDNTITSKQLQSLSVSLRTQPISWVKAFIEAQGQLALTTVLLKINRRQASGPMPANDANSTDKDLEREYDIVKCLKALMNNKYGADDALDHDQIPVALATCLISPRLTTRKLVSEVSHVPLPLG